MLLKINIHIKDASVCNARSVITLEKKRTYEELKMNYGRGPSKRKA